MKFWRSFLYITVLQVAYPSVGLTFDAKIAHNELSSLAASNSQVGIYIRSQLGIQDIDTLLKSEIKKQPTEKTIVNWLREGAKLEDDPSCRAASHFHNPLLPWNEAQLTDPIWIVDRWCDATSPFRTKYSNLVWATGYIAPDQTPLTPPVNNNPDDKSNGRNWDVARNFLYRSLTEQDPVLRESYLAQTFYTLGYVLHLLQDVAVPAHTRNDFSQGHTNAIGCPAGGCETFTDWIGNPFEGYVRSHFATIETNIPDMNLPFSGPKTLTNFWDADTYHPESAPPTAGQDIGLSEYSNGNFVSYSTVLKEDPDDEHYFPYPNKESIVDPNLPGYVSEEVYQTMKEDGKLDRSIYIAKKQHGETMEKFLTWRYVAFESATFMKQTYLSFKPDDDCFMEYAKRLIPRAVGYSAGLIDYFFRGTLEISPPTEYVYSIIDGGTGPQQFAQIKANVKNTSMIDTGTGTPIPEVAGTGELVAVAKYRIMPNYAEDLSSYPQSVADLDIAMKDVPFSYSVSAPVSITSLNPLRADAANEYLFDFSEDPIPAGVTDLLLQLVFRGTLGSEQNAAVAMGMKDLNEPQHLTFWNDTDYFLLNGIPVKAETIESDPWVEFYGYIWPFSYNETLSFSQNYPDTTPLPVVEITNQPPARYVRLILLTDASDTEYYITDHLFAERPTPPIGNAPTAIDATWKYSEPSTTTQLDANGNWAMSPVYTGRGIRQHNRLYYMSYYPLFGYVNSLPAPPENSLGPYPATIHFPITQQ